MSWRTSSSCLFANSCASSSSARFRFRSWELEANCARRDVPWVLPCTLATWMFRARADLNLWSQPSLRQLLLDIWFEGVSKVVLTRTVGLSTLIPHGRAIMSHTYVPASMMSDPAPSSPRQTEGSARHPQRSITSALRAHNRFARRSSCAGNFTEPPHSPGIHQRTRS